MRLALKIGLFVLPVLLGAGCTPLYKATAIELIVSEGCLVLIKGMSIEQLKEAEDAWTLGDNCDVEVGINRRQTVVTFSPDSDQLCRNRSGCVHGDQIILTDRFGEGSYWANLDATDVFFPHFAGYPDNRGWLECGEVFAAQLGIDVTNKPNLAKLICHEVKHLYYGPSHNQ